MYLLIHRTQHYLTDHGFLSKESVVRMTNGCSGEMAMARVILATLESSPPVISLLIRHSL